MPKFIIIYGKFGRHEDAAGNLLSPAKGGTLVRRVPGDIIEMSHEEAALKRDSVRAATQEEIDAFEARKASGAPAPLPVNQAATQNQHGPLPSKKAPKAPKAAAVPQAAAPAAAAHPAPVFGTPAVPAAVPAAPPAPAADSTAKPRARSKSTGKKKSTAK